ncbi:hypothetical protein Tco_1510586, partial [Tanacetum coccineum]
YLIDLFIWGLHPEIKENFHLFKPRSLSDACSLANLQETTNNLLKKKVSSSSLHLYVVKDSSEAMNEDFGLVSIDVVSKEDVKSKEIKPNDSRKVGDNESLMDEADGKKFVENGFRLRNSDDTQGSSEEDGKGRKIDLSRVVNNNIDLKNLFEGSKEGDKDVENHDEEVLENKEMIGLADFGCNESGRKVENGRGDDTFGYEFRKF